MALLRRIEHPTAGNTEVNFLLNLYILCMHIFLKTENTVATSSFEVKS